MDAVVDRAIAHIRERLAEDITARFSAPTGLHRQLVPQLIEQLQSSQLEQHQQQQPLAPDFLPPFMIAVGSCAGAGKTTFSQSLSTRLQGASFTFSCNNETQNRDENQNDSENATSNNTVTFSLVIDTVPMVLPVDGYHRYRSELDAMDDPAEAHRRRGAPYTFNSAKYRAHMETLRRTGRLSAPAFEHAVRDPQEDFYDVNGISHVSIVLAPRSRVDAEEHNGNNSNGNNNNNHNNNNNDNAARFHITIHRRIVIIEGIYALMDEVDTDDENWTRARDQHDVCFYMRLPIEMATERLVRRHMAAWNQSEEEARARAAGSDRDNGLLVMAAAERMLASATGRPCVALDSVDDAEFVTRTVG